MEEFATKKPKIVTTSLPDWPNLPISLTELFLERLPLPDYIRFGSVCTRWLAVQKEHRLRHAPFPPPMQKPQFIWLVPYLHCFDKKSIDCFSLTDSELYHVSFPSTAFTFHFLASCHGWLLMLSKHSPKPPFQVSIYNPLFSSQVQLPPIMALLGGKSFGALSAPPTHLNCVALMVDDVHCDFYLCMLYGKQSDWAKVSLPPDQRLLHYQNKWSGIVYHDDRFYCFGKWNFERVIVVNTEFPTPSAQVVEMEFSNRNDELWANNVYVDSYLAEFDNEVLLVQELKNKVRIFKADFSRMKWVEVRGGIGHHRVLFVGFGGSLCMLASDVSGFSGNCIYDFKHAHVFCFDTMQWMDDPVFSSMQKAQTFNQQKCHWLLPSLDYVDHESCSSQF